ncbi:MAG: DUF2283 domain-containing protein [Candidatus Brocadia sp.]|nr:DUF2283 domain-containing protein [Candidatus Brocadia sp.]
MQTRLQLSFAAIACNGSIELNPNITYELNEGGELIGIEI